MAVFFVNGRHPFGPAAPLPRHDPPFGNPAELLITPDHYVYRMLYSQGVTLPELGIAPEVGDRSAIETDSEVVGRAG